MTARMRCLAIAVLLAGTVCTTLANVEAELATPGAQAVAAPASPVTPYECAAIWPSFTPANLAWFAAVVVLSLTLRLRPLLSLRNLDALVLAAMCILIAARGHGGIAEGGPHSAPWWGYLGLTLAALYWIFRAVILTFIRKPLRFEATMSSSATVVLLAAGLAICIHQLATAPLTDESRAGLIGGLCTTDTGKLPYGYVPNLDTHSPLFYLVHAGAVALVPPTWQQGDVTEAHPLAWQESTHWPSDWDTGADVSAARFVNAALFIGLLVALYGIGYLLQAPAIGAILMAIVCVFPGTVESLGHPAIMLPTVLVAWTFFLALVPGVGGLLAGACLVLAGFAWPWAWLGLPVLLAYFWRRGWHGFGATIGVVAMSILCLWSVTTYVAPALPRESGALSRARTQPEYNAHYEDGVIYVKPRNTREAVAPTVTYSASLWGGLLDADPLTLEDLKGATPIVLPNGVSHKSIRISTIVATDEVRNLLHAPYDAAAAKLQSSRRIALTLRTLFEQTWLPVEPPHPDVTGAWEEWSGSPVLTGRWVTARRLAKGFALFLTFALALVILFSREPRPRHLAAGLLAVFSAVLLASQSGAVSNLVWLMPPVLTLWGLFEIPESRIVAAEAARFDESPEAGMSGEDGPAPRITIDR